MGEQKQRMLRGELYRDSDPERVAERIRAHRLCAEFNRTGPWETERRDVVLRLLRGGDGRA
ncbi:maltose acetyltransferase domain-containing protein [Nocardia sp. NPDC052112]|uniref:maltose acetyltransferase domain-containing protein n=1 Tax=Nocardia sp. NPDC052112 TaxID=3155646 RepID=UPI0034274A4B